jgi:hypothetical protein
MDIIDREENKMKNKNQLYDNEKYNFPISMIVFSLAIAFCIGAWFGVCKLIIFMANFFGDII